MNEKLNSDTAKKYIETLRTTKKLEVEKYNQRETLLFRYYGMIDTPLDTVEKITGDAHKTGRYEYRIGNTESAFRTIPSLKFILEPKEDLYR